MKKICLLMERYGVNASDCFKIQNTKIGPSYSCPQGHFHAVFTGQFFAKNL